MALRNAFWLALIAGALCAIAGGFVQGTLTAHPPPIVRLRARPDRRLSLGPRALPRQRERAQPVDDAFSRDEVVVERAPSREERWQPERLALVGLCGYSFAAESQWMRLGFPLAFIVSPGAPQAARFSALVRRERDALFVQLGNAPSRAQIADLRARLGALSGVASREPAGMAAALLGSGLAFLDERGDAADARAFARAGVRLIRRDVTADDVAEPGYVAFMLARAAALSRRVGAVVVLVRPEPVTLSAVRAFSQAHDVQMVSLR